MKPMMKSMRRLGRVIMKNKGKLLMALGAMALAPMVRWALTRYPGLRAEIEESEESREGPPKPPKLRRGKREIYEAPQVPPANLVRHR